MVFSSSKHRKTGRKEVSLVKPDEERLQKAYNLGFYYEKEYRGCCQSALAAIQDILGVENEAAFRAGTALAGGGCSTGEGFCGGLIGGIMAIGSQMGRERKNFKDPEGLRFKTREVALRLYRKFVDEYGGARCCDVQTKMFGRRYNLLDPADFEAFEAQGAHVDKCPSVVGNVARWAVEIIDSIGEGDTK
jgi:C_GCAxxG_C_C family probable redox protein